MELVEPSHSASMAPLPGSVTGLLSHLITTVRLALKAIGAAAPLLDVSCSGSSWRSLICIDDTEYAGLICCCYQEPQHCVVTKVGRLIGRTFLQSAAPVFVDRCTFFVFTDEPLAKQDQTAPDDFDGTNDRDYRPLLDPLDQPSETAPFAGDRCAQRLKIAAVLTAGAAVYRAQPTPSLHARDAKSLPRAGKVSGSEPATMAEAHARASSAWHKAEADEMQSPFGITGSSAHDRYTHDTPHTHTHHTHPCGSKTAFPPLTCPQYTSVSWLCGLLDWMMCCLLHLLLSDGPFAMRYGAGLDALLTSLGMILMASHTLSIC